MSIGTDRPNRFPWPPVITVSLIVLAIVLDRVAPFGWRPSTAGGQMLRLAGILLAGLAALLYVTSARTMWKARTNILPHRPADHLVTSGPFAISRNPIYLGNVLLLAGAGLFFGNAWFILAAAVGGFAEQKLAIEREERHLEHKFGKAWRDYRKKVRRWI